MKLYCVKEKQFTDNVPGSEEYVKTKNNRTMLKATCASCGIIKSRFVKSTGGSLMADALFPAVGSLLYNSGRLGLSEAVKSDAARSMMKNYAKKFIDQGINNVTNDLSKKIKT